MSAWLDSASGSDSSSTTIARLVAVFDIGGRVDQLCGPVQVGDFGTFVDLSSMSDGVFGNFMPREDLGLGRSC